jgi:23S rRNA pseudouridine2605 synthase
MTSFIRLNKFLSSSGISSRRGVEKIIFEKKVKINGYVVDQPQKKIDSTKDLITVNNVVIRPEKKVYYLLNKPRGYVCSNSRIHPQEKIINDLFPSSSRLFTIGRLDKTTVGLLLVTNDGDFAQRIIHPSNNLSKEYLIKTKQLITAEHLLTISSGIFIYKKLIKPVVVKKVRKSTFKIVIKEGKKHEVRLFCEKAGLEIILLKRIRLGPFQLGSIQEGTYRELTEKEKKSFLI